MMDRQLADIAEHGEPVAVLGASEAGIYRRYGYGVAAEKATLEIARDHARFAAPPPADAGRVRLVNRVTALAELPDTYDAVRVGQAGMLTRIPAAWSHLTLPESADDGATHYALHENEHGEIDGYAVYRTNPRWRDGLAAGELTVRELLATSPVIQEVLWRYVVGVDLVASIAAEGRPVDDALTWMPLSTRAYGATDALVLQVIDDRAPGWAAGDWLLEVTPEGAAVSHTGRPAVLVLEAADLAAAYLGGVSFTTLARAGRVHGDTRDVRRADQLFAWAPAPWAPS